MLSEPVGGTISAYAAQINEFPAAPQQSQKLHMYFLTALDWLHKCEKFILAGT